MSHPSTGTIRRFLVALSLTALALSGCSSISTAEPSQNRDLSSYSAGSRAESRVFGFPKPTLSAEEAAAIPDLYSRSLTSDKESYLWQGAATEYNLEVDRILPLHQAMQLTPESWTPVEKKRFGADRDNFSVTSHVANSWKEVKTPSAMLAASAQGTFSWTDDCVEDYRPLFQRGSGCSGLPEDFDRCGYSESYSLIASRYGLKIPEADSEALKELSEGC